MLEVDWLAGRLDGELDAVIRQRLLGFEHAVADGSAIADLDARAGKPRRPVRERLVDLVGVLANRRGHDQARACAGSSAGALSSALLSVSSASSAIGDRLTTQSSRASARSDWAMASRPCSRSCPAR